MIVIGIDPGAESGLALFQNGGLRGILTVEPDAVFDHLDEHRPDLVVYEDSRLQRVIWPPPKLALQGKLNYARSVGYVDYQCKEIERWCEANGLTAIGLSPKQKGRKVVNAELFNKMMGWRGSTSQHGRDAALLAYRFRHGAQVA